MDNRTRWLALVILCLGDLMIVLDTTIVNVALPSIRADLGFSQTSLAWVVNAYQLTFGGFLLLGGRLGDIFGHRLLFLIGIALMSLGAWFTDLIGLHAVFGAFIMGASMPRGIMVRDLCARIQPLAVALLLPLFFTYSGLNTKIGLLNTGFLWMMCAAVLAAAVLGKGIACWLAARATGLSNREALGIGTLMNARGLMELIIINIGLQKGIISEGLFATLVIMAVITTLMASPIFERLVGSGKFEAEA